jgi:hypothetical protein
MIVMARTLLCRKCGHWYQIQITTPDICPHCEQSASWTIDPDPDKPYRLSENDRKLLRSFKITPEP